MGRHASDLLYRAKLPAGKAGLLNRVRPQDAGWEHLDVELHRLARGETWSSETDGREGALVVLGGRCSIASNRGEWAEIGRRRDVFDGMPWALYLPRGSELAVSSDGDPLEFAWCRVPAERDGEARLITPDDIRVELRGGHANSRQLNHIIPPGFGCERIVCLEVYTPAGNWSSYPPHKHDVHREAGGEVVEADLEEVYCYKFDKPDGWAMQRVYTDDGSIDAAVVARDGDIVLVPEGYHPVCTGYGYHCYYLNFLAGSAQSLACVDDPAHAWVKETWTGLDPRLPMVSRGMEPR